MLYWTIYLIVALTGTPCEEVDHKQNNILEKEMSELQQIHHYQRADEGSISKIEMLHELIVKYFDKRALAKRGRRDCSDCSLYKDFPPEYYKCIHLLKRLLQGIIVREPRSTDSIGRFLRVVILPICLVGSDVVYINESRSICCNGSLEEKVDHKTCCNEEMIDKAKHICCNDTIYERQAHKECCGRFMYDTKQHACCADTLIHLKNHTCCNESFELSSPGKCCSSADTSETCIVCEENKVVAKPINVSSHLCCSGVIKARKHVCRIGHSTTIKTQVATRSQNIITYDKNESLLIQIIFGTGLGVLLCVGSACSICCFCKRCNIQYIRLRGGKGDCTHCSHKIEKVQKTYTLPSNSSRTQDDNGKTCKEISLPLFREISSKPRNNFYKDITSFTDNDRTKFDETHFNSKLVIDLEKITSSDIGNITGNYLKDSQTQTFINDDKYKRNIFGEPFDQMHAFDKSKRVLQLQDSEAQLTLPKSMTKSGSTEVYASTFRDPQSTADKLNLLENQSIVSPAVEFCLVSSQKLDDFACVRLPFVGEAKYLTVIKFESDEGLHAHTRTVDVPRKDKKNEDLDLFYVVEEKTVLIYTKSFSGFVCSMCKCKRELELVAFLFGSYKRINEKYEVYIRVYVADILYVIADYKKNLFYDEEENQKRKCLEPDFQIDLPECDLDGNDYIEACFTHKDGVTAWQHDIHPNRGQPTFDEKQKIKLMSIAKKCQSCFKLPTCERRIYKNWYLHNVQNVVPEPEFQCYINLDVCKKDTNIRETNNILVDNLYIREADRKVIKESAPVQECNSLGETGQPTNRLRPSSATDRNQTLVRAESEQNIRWSSSSTFDSRSVAPSPELSHLNETMPYLALPYRNSSTSGTNNET